MLELRAGDAIVAVDPDRGLLARLTVGGFDLLTDQGCFVMAPWAGRTGDGRFTFDGVEHHLPVPAKHAPHAIHGTVRERAWAVEDAQGDRVRLAIDLGPDWPWPGRCEHRLVLAPASLTLELAVHSGGDRFPAILGWHPWFAKPAAVDLGAAAMLERGADRLPTGTRVGVAPTYAPLDDCFEDVAWPILLRWPAIELAVESDCRYAVVFTEPADATCVEPQTGPPNGLVTGEHAVVTSERPLAATTRWSWRASS